MERNLMRSTVSLRLRLLAGGVALATTVSLGVWGTTPAGAAVRHPHHELSAGPSVDKNYPGLLCDFDHKSWCIGTGPKAKTTFGEIEIVADYMTVVLFVVATIKGVIWAVIKFRRWWHTGGGGHERPYMVGNCLTQSNGQVIWGKCAKGTTGAAVTSQTWKVEYFSNGADGFVNEYWLNKGKSLWLTEPAKIVANGRLRLHAMFGLGTGGIQLQEWHAKGEPAGSSLDLKPGEPIRL
jgi:hypothetical protein